VSADTYLQSILDREAVDTSIFSPVRAVQVTLEPIIKKWANVSLVNVTPTGSFAKGTANRSGTDIDLFISLSSQTPETLREIYNKLFTFMSQSGYTPKRQNVSINVRVSGFSVDLVPAKRHDNFSDDHSLYRRRADTWTKTNVVTHINHVSQSHHTNEIRIVKLWRDQNALDFPSFYLELSVIAALSGKLWGSLSANVWECFKYLRDTFANARVIDPANTNNIISDDLSALGKTTIKSAAEKVLKAKTWGEIVV